MQGARPRAPETHLTVRRGARPSATQQTCPYPPPQQKPGEKFGLARSRFCRPGIPGYHEHNGAAPREKPPLRRGPAARIFAARPSLEKGRLMDLAHLIAVARSLYADEPFGVELANTVYALESSTIDLCLSVFPWAPYRDTDAAIKLHTLLDVRGSIPALIHISDGKMNDVRILDQIVPEPGAIYIMDRGYLDPEQATPARPIAA